MTREEFFKRYTFNHQTDRLGAGSFGTVFRAYDTVLDRWVALKIASVNHESYRLRNEVELVKSLGDHKNVAGYEDCFTFSDATGEIDVAILQYYSEGSLSDMVERGLLTTGEVAEILTQVLEGLRFLHSHGIIHRDLKPSNILMARRAIDNSLVPKITDFGISKQMDEDGDSTMTATPATLNYASPEQLTGSLVSANSDLWSFGVIAYRLFTGHLPFTSGSHDPASMLGQAEIVNKITSGRIPADVAQLPAPWDRLVQECLVADPTVRISSEARLLQMIKAASLTESKQAPAFKPVKPLVQPTVVDKSDAHEEPKAETGKISYLNFMIWAFIIIIVVLVSIWTYKVVLSYKSESSKLLSVPMVEPMEADVRVIEDEPVEVIDSSMWNVKVDTTAVVDDAAAVVDTFPADDTAVFDDLESDTTVKR